MILIIKHPDAERNTPSLSSYKDPMIKEHIDKAIGFLVKSRNANHIWSDFLLPTGEIPYLLRTQLPDGSWKAYWWQDTVYAVALAVRALIMRGHEKHSAEIGIAAQWAHRLFGGKDYVSTPEFPAGSPFATALALKTMLMDA